MADKDKDKKKEDVSASKLNRKPIIGVCIVLALLFFGPLIFRGCSGPKGSSKPGSTTPSPTAGTSGGSNVSLATGTQRNSNGGNWSLITAVQINGRTDNKDDRTVAEADMDVNDREWTPPLRYDNRVITINGAEGCYRKTNDNRVFVYDTAPTGGEKGFYEYPLFLSKNDRQTRFYYGAQLPENVWIAYFMSPYGVRKIHYRIQTPGYH